MNPVTKNQNYCLRRIHTFHYQGQNLFMIYEVILTMIY